MAAKQGAKDRIIVAAIAAEAGMSKAEIAANAQIKSEYINTFGDKLLDTLGGTEAAVAAVEQIKDQTLGMFKGNTDDYGPAVQQKLLEGSSMQQALEDSFTRFDGLITKQGNLIYGLGAHEQFYAKDEGSRVVSDILTRSVMENNPDLSAAQVQRTIQGILKNKKEFSSTALEAKVYYETTAKEAAILKRAATVPFGSSGAADIQALIDQATGPDSTPSLTIKKFAEGFKEIPEDPAMTQLAKDLEKQYNEVGAPKTTTFGNFFLDYTANPNKDTLNRIIGVRDDKNAAFFYIDNPNMLQSAVAGIQKFQDDPSFVDAYEPGEPLPEQELNDLRNQLAKDLGVRHLSKNVSPVRLRLALAKRTPLQFDPATQRKIEEVEDTQPTVEEQNEASDAQTTADEIDASGMRVVDGKGGYKYGQTKDGTIHILDGPTGKGSTLTKGPAHTAITKEIGESNSVPNVMFNKPPPSKTLMTSLKATPTTGQPTTEKSVAKEIQEKGKAQAEQFDMEKGKQFDMLEGVRLPPTAKEQSELASKKRQSNVQQLESILKEREELQGRITSIEDVLYRTAPANRSEVGQKKKAREYFKSELDKNLSGVTTKLPNNPIAYQDPKQEQQYNEAMRSAINEYENKYGSSFTKQSSTPAPKKKKFLKLLQQIPLFHLRQNNLNQLTKH